MPLPLPLPCKGPHGAPLTLYVFLCKADSIDIRCRLPLMRRNRMWLLFGRPAQTLVDRRRYSDVHTEWGKYAHTGVDTQALCMGGPSICWPGGGRGNSCAWHFVFIYCSPGTSKFADDCAAVQSVMCLVDRCDVPWRDVMAAGLCWMLFVADCYCGVGDCELLTYLLWCIRLFGFELWFILIV